MFIRLQQVDASFSIKLAASVVSGRAEPGTLPALRSLEGE